MHTVFMQLCKNVYIAWGICNKYETINYEIED